MINLSQDIEIEILQTIDWCFYLSEMSASKEDIKEAFTNACAKVLKMKEEMEEED